MLGHKSLLSTEVYINLEQACFPSVNEELIMKVAKNVDEACKLIEVGFEYVTDMDGLKLFRRRK